MKKNGVRSAVYGVRSADCFECLAQKVALLGVNYRDGMETRDSEFDKVGLGWPRDTIPHLPYLHEHGIYRYDTPFLPEYGVSGGAIWIYTWTTKRN